MSGNGPVLNRGCQALLFTTCKILDGQFPGCSFLAATFGKDSPESLPPNVEPFDLGVDYSRWSSGWWKWRMRHAVGLREDFADSARRLAPRLDGCAALLSVGGDNYSLDFGDTIVERLIAMDSRAKQKGIPVVIWGASIGPFSQNPAFEERMARHLATVDLVVVREPESRDYLLSLGVKDNVMLAPDPAFLLEGMRPDLSPELQEMVEAPFLGVNLSPLLASYRSGGNIAKWSREVAHVLAGLLRSHEYPILLIPHVTSLRGLGSVDDHVFLTSVRAQLDPRQQHRVAVVPGTFSCSELKWLISKAHAFVGSRTHATIAAFSSGVPCVSIAYSVKASGINQLLFSGQQWVVRVQDFSAPVLEEKLGSLLRDRDGVRAVLMGRMASIQGEFGAPVRKLVDVISAYS